MLNKTDKGKVFLDLGHINRRELLELYMCYIEKLGTR